jgi:hypothetical protein
MTILPGDGGWWLPGGAVVTDSGRKLRLHPPESWDRVILDIPRVPPSMNRNEIRSSWRGFHEAKRAWQTEMELLLMAAKCKRGYNRAWVGCFLRFARRQLRDPSNYRGLIDKSCGDSLTAYGAIVDDDEPHYYFGGVEIEPERGPARTLLYVYLDPTNKGG